MPPKGIATRKRLADRMELLRRGNVKRHADYSARLKLQTDRAQHQRNATFQRELDNLHESSLRGSGLDRVRIDRMNALRAIIK
jgi:hypothetical protein